MIQALKSGILVLIIPPTLGSVGMFSSCIVSAIRFAIPTEDGDAVRD